MIITDDYIFVHIPKTAGTSIQHALTSRNIKTVNRAPAVLNRYAGPRSPSQSIDGHGTLRDLIDKVGSKNIDISSKFTFAFVRNPWDRALSLYYHFTERGKNHRRWKDLIPHYEEIGFNRWVTEELQQLTLPPDTHMHTSWIERHSIHYQQCEWIAPKVDFIGRFENLEEDFNKVCRKLRIRCKLPHINQTSHKHYTEVYNQEAKEKVAQLFAQDIQRFDYKF